MRVRLQRQAKVSAVFRVVDRLLHRAQQHGLQHLRIRPIGDLRQQFGIVDRLGFGAARQRKAQLVEHGAEAGDAVVAGAIVIAEQRRLLMLLDKARRRDVGEDHALFDQLVRVVAHGALYALDAAFRIEDKLRFFGLERDAAP